MSEKKITGYAVRLKNRRVWLGKAPDGSFGLSFRRLGCKSDGEPRIVDTQLNLSAEAMQALVGIYTSRYLRI